MGSGAQLGRRYLLRERIGTGGMGEVWRADDTLLKRTVAIKRLHPARSEDADFRARFQHEARTVAALNSPGVVDIYDIREETADDGTTSCYLVMQYVTGRPLSSILSEFAPLTAAETFPLIGQVAEALEAAHRAGIVHRDIKPDNILVSPTGVTTLVDFGIARRRGDAGMTTTGTVMGTVDYASPEQLSDHPLTGASDIYSLGVVGYECLTGEPPFSRDSVAAVINGHLHDEPPALPSTISEAAARTLLRAMAKDPADRYDSALKFAQACRRATAGRRGRTTRKITGAIPVPLKTPAIPPPKERRVDTTPPTTKPRADDMFSPHEDAPTTDESAPATDEEHPERRSHRLAWLVGAATMVALTVGVGAVLITSTQGDSAANPSPGADPSVSESDGAPDEPPGPRPSEIVSVGAGGLCLLAFDEDADPGVHLDLCDGSRDEVYRFRPIGEGDFLIVTRSPTVDEDYCLSARTQSRVELIPCEKAGAADAWGFELLRTTGGIDFWRVHGVADRDLCLAPDDEAVTLTDCTASADQEWRTNA